MELLDHEMIVKRKNMRTFSDSERQIKKISDEKCGVSNLR